ncbi:MAG: dihydroorotase, partial [Rhodocyclaceae bacterium]
MNILIKNVRLLDPSKNIDANNADIYIANGKIFDIVLDSSKKNFAADKIIQADGLIACPGLIDLSARLNSIEVELAAATAGGITTLVVPPDTTPPLDEPELADRLIHRAKDVKKTKVFPLGALTLGLEGKKLAELAGLKKVGCIAFSQANRPIIDTQSLLRTLQYAATFGFCVWYQPQDFYLSQNGFAHDGLIASRLGLAAIPVAAETISLLTLLELAKLTNVKLHFMRLSTTKGVEILQQNEYKNNITYDVNIHHLLMTENNINYFDTNAKFVPPLRSENDRQSLNKAIINNDNVAITSDHTPISAENKLLPFGEAKAGASGVELLLPLTLLWAKQNQVSLLEAIKKITAIPAKIIRTAVNDDSEKNLQNLGTLNIGGNADLCLFDENESWQICEKNLKSRGKNTPFFNETLNGKVK